MAGRSPLANTRTNTRKGQGEGEASFSGEDGYRTGRRPRNVENFCCRNQVMAHGGTAKRCRATPDQPQADAGATHAARVHARGDVGSGRRQCTARQDGDRRRHMRIGDVALGRKARQRSRRSTPARHGMGRPVAAGAGAEAAGQVKLNPVCTASRGQSQCVGKVEFAQGGTSHVGRQDGRLRAGGFRRRSNRTLPS